MYMLWCSCWLAFALCLSLTLSPRTYTCIFIHVLHSFTYTMVRDDECVYSYIILNTNDINALRNSLPTSSWYKQVNTSLHTHIHKYIHTYICTHKNTCIHINISYIHTYIHIYIHMYINIYIHTCIHAYTRTFKQKFKHTNIQTTHTGTTYVHTHKRMYVRTYVHNGTERFVYYIHDYIYEMTGASNWTACKHRRWCLKCKGPFISNLAFHITITVRKTTRAERWGAGVETQKNVREEIGGWGRVPFNEPYAPLLSTIYDGA